MTAPRRRQTVSGRPGKGPVRTLSEVLMRRRQGAYWTLSVSAAEVAERARPGQFVNVATEAQSALLRRPFSISTVSRSGPAAGTVEIVFEAYGPGTEWLAGLQTHDTVDLVGPLGAPFPLPRRRVPCLLVGGGYGVAPLFFLADVLGTEGMRVDMVVGARSQDRLYNTIEAKRVTAGVTFTTEDGSYGRRGTVTDVFDAAVERCDAAVVYACGPMPMLRAVTRLSAARGLPCQVAVEEHMACGTGVCWTCVVPVRDDQDRVRMRRSCLEGPVFDGARVAWEESRWGAGESTAGSEDDAGGGVDDTVPAAHPQEAV